MEPRGIIYKILGPSGKSYIGKTIQSLKTEEEAKEALERYKKDPENFVRPNQRKTTILE
jgi:hypothetical protein